MTRVGLKLTLTAVSICGLAVSSPAQSPAAAEIAAEKGFTIPSGVPTPMVLRTQPDAACEMHPEGLSDAARTLRLYSDGEGYVRVHVSPKYRYQQDVRLQLDCTAAGSVTTYPVHLHSGTAPTVDMPAPQTSAPTPKGAHILPALTDEDAKKLSDKDLISQGYLRRPDAMTSPDSYHAWLGLISQPTTQLPPHTVKRSDVSHLVRNIQAGTKTSANWSGYEAQATKGSYDAVQGEWNVPTIAFGENGYVTFSAFWVGLDGDGTTDLIQAGTDQDYAEMGSFVIASYYAWTELLPNQPTEHQVSLPVDPGDDIFVKVMATAGSEPCDLIWNKTKRMSIGICTPLGGTQVAGSEAEWIMERPCLGQCGTSNPELAELAAYATATMTNVYVWPTNPWGPLRASQAATEQINMYNDYLGHPDNDLLSLALPLTAASISFRWINFH